MKIELRKVITLYDVWYRIFIDDKLYWSYLTLEEAEKLFKSELERRKFGEQIETLRYIEF
jgi:hypothetical protein